MKLSKAMEKACEALADPPQGRGERGEAKPKRVRRSTFPRKLAAGWVVELSLPCTVVSEMNSGRKGEHWAATKRRKDVQATALRVVLYRANLYAKWRPDFPLVVTWTHVGRPMDEHDGLRSAFKWLVDAMAAFLGVDDGETDKVTWEYRQELPTGGTPGVRVEVCPKV